MKKFTALVVTLMLCLSASFAVAAETMKGTVKKVDKKASTITFTPEGTKEEKVLTVDPSVDLKKLKGFTKVELTVDGGVVKELKMKGSAAGY